MKRRKFYSLSFNVFSFRFERIECMSKGEWGEGWRLGRNPLKVNLFFHEDSCQDIWIQPLPIMTNLQIRQKQFYPTLISYFRMLGKQSNLELYRIVSNNIN